jgi:NitT/TauT family transport system substrate-binding protein
MRLLIVALPVLLSLSMVSHAVAADKIKLTLNWVPEPEFGGIYAAKQSGAFEKHGLDVDIAPGGAGTPTWQLVATGKVDFAVASADEVIIARSQGANVVAFFATYQTCPQGIMVHGSRNLKGFDDLFKAGGKLAVEPGLAYVNFLKTKYSFDKMKLVAYDGGIGNFLNDPNFAQQCFITSEPLAAKKAGSDPQVFLVADAGYNPYTAVIITRSDIARSRAQQVENLASALRDGWRAYLDNPKSANEMMAGLNPDMSLETMSAAAEAQKPLIETDETKKNGLGSMTLERWRELTQQLVDLGVVKKDKAPTPNLCFIGTKPAGS